MRIGSRSRSRAGTIVVAVWLIIGLLAAIQRGYLSGGNANCAKLSTIVVTVVAGPLNYLGVNPQIDCKTPQPSK